MASMEVQASSSENGNGPLRRGWRWVKDSPNKLWAEVVQFGKMIRKLAKDDPRRIIHPFKEGLAITLVSLFYYFKPLYQGFGSNAMWAVLTVVVVFEFSVGATLGKGLNRMLATLVGGALGLGIHRLSTFTGETAEPIIIGFSEFTTAAIATYVRFIPKMKARYDYGVLIFILTFCLVSVSGYRDDEVLHMAHQRLSTIVIGCCAALVVCISICPVWIGEDLHNLVALNIEKLANFLQGFGGEYFKIPDDQDGQSKSTDKSLLEGYKSVLTSKSSEETMANLATWEPPHGGFRFRHPWKQYLKVGILIRQCAYKIETLNGYLNSQTQTPEELRLKIQEPCREISSEASKALKELASVLRTMTRPSSTINPHIENSKAAAENLKSLLKTGLWEDADNLLEIIQAAAVATMLMDVVTCIEKIAEAVHELASLAYFKRPKADQAAPAVSMSLVHRGTVRPICSVHGADHEERVVTVDESSPSIIFHGGGGGGGNGSARPAAAGTARQIEV